jgi:hypothetical protein
MAKSYRQEIATATQIRGAQTPTVAANACTPDATLGNTINVSNAATVTINNLTGLTTDHDGCEFRLRIKNTGGSAISIVLGTTFRFGSQLTALSTIAAGKTNYVGCVYNSADSKLDVVSEQLGF